MSKTNVTWGGRFTESTDAFVEKFNASVDFDQRMYNQDIDGSIAHAKMLHNVGVLSEQDRDAIIDGLEAIRSEIAAGDFPLVHSAGRRAYEYRSAPHRAYRRCR